MFRTGDVVDNRYDIVGPLGHGGMARVFRAQDRHLDRMVALKVLRPHLTEEDSERFRREIRALAQLNHPGIVSIFDLGLGDNVYFAMELIEGGPLTDLGPLEPDTESFDRLMRAAITVAEALGYVHRLGMVHRDLTPRNILLTRQHHPKVMDFGLVQLTETSKQLTRTGFTLGTPQYMAPEQARGDATGAHTDLYAFGAVLYRTVTGVAPFDADNDQAVLYQHVYGNVTPAHELNPQVPLALSHLITSLLEKDPHQRPLSGSAVADALHAIHAAERSRSPSYPQAGPARRGVYPVGPTTPDGLSLRWTTKLDEGPQWPAGIGAAANFILIGLRNDRLAVLRPADGGQQITFDLDDEASSSPVYAHGMVLVTSRDGALQAIAWPQGERLWTASDAEAVGVLPYGANLLVTTRRGGVEARTTSGEVTWRYDDKVAAATHPVLHRAKVHFFSVDGWLHSVYAQTGRPSFKVQVGEAAAAPTASGDVLVLPERSGELHAFDLESHEVLWTYDLEGELWSTPVIWDGLVFAAGWSQTLHALSLRSGDDVWSQPLPAPVTASPVLAAGALYLVTEAGDLLAFDARSGRPLWQRRLSHGPIQASPLPLGDSLIVAALSGEVFSLG